MFLALALTAAATEDACNACCRAGGLSGCSASIQVFGDGSRIAREGEAWRVAGVWDLTCDQPPRFNSSAAMILDHPPLGGELLVTQQSPLQVHCFLQACGLPVGTCVSKPDDDGRFFLQDCASGLPADASAMSRSTTQASHSGSTVVVLGGRPLVVQSVGANGSTADAPRTNQGGGYRDPAQPSAAAPQPSYSAPVTPSYSAPVTPNYSAQPPPLSPAAAASATPMPGDPFAAFAASLPADPPATCKPPGELLRAEARKRVDSGDEKRVVNDAPGALQEYRAALSMDICNAYAWLGIGDVATTNARPDLAVRALSNATRILPGHYGAWTQLGSAYEALKQVKLAAEAYTKALELRPGLPEALEGWRRTAMP